ncbi:MAG: hypothetical protein E7A34_10755, partial [Leclercia adecarboxylata]|nr:hypothetical protein [Leclercia adecarboxylata]
MNTVLVNQLFSGRENFFSCVSRVFVHRLMVERSFSSVKGSSTLFLTRWVNEMGAVSLNASTNANQATRIAMNPFCFGMPPLSCDYRTSP